MTDELGVIRATIEAAQIQKWGTIYGALIGGFALGVGVFASWLTSLHLQKVARLAETRKTVYLELVENYSQMITGFQLLLPEFDKRWEIQNNLVLEFCRSIDKATFICETKTKEEIYNFLNIFVVKLRQIQAKINPLIVEKNEVDDLYSRHSRVMDLFDNASKEYENIKLFGEKIDKIPLIQKYFDEKIKESEGYIESMKKIDENVNKQSKEIRPLIIDLINESNMNANKIVHLLREELGAKTNIELDKKLQSLMIIE